MKRISLLGMIFALSFGIAAWPQEQSAGTAQEKKVVREAPIKSTVPISGRGMYGEYCAVCHGKEGKGDGPAASELKVPPPDLTMLAKHNNGKYPSDHVASILRFGTPAPAHGTADMPIWGTVLGTSAIHGTDLVKVQQRISKLTDFIESLQVR